MDNFEFNIGVLYGLVDRARSQFKDLDAEVIETLEHFKGNRRAMVAGPALLDACIMAQAQLGDLVREGGATDDDIEAYEAVKTAIEKAEDK